MRSALALFALCWSIPVAAQVETDDPRYHEGEFYAERVHSDLPLYNFDWEDLWPRNFRDEDSYGCASTVNFGDWEFTPNPTDEFGDPWWMRITNYGVFHCAANFWTADERDELPEDEFSRGFFVMIAETERSGRPVELWAVQEGFIPGSDYLLLAREPGGELIEIFTVLQRRCPDGAMRELDGGMNVWLTDYCAINSREALVDLAENMLDHPPLGTLELRGEPEGITSKETGDPLDMEDAGPI